MSKTILDENSVGNLCGGQLTVVFNTESIWHYRRNETYRRFVTECQNIAIDGVGLLLALRLKGHRVHRYHGPDLCNDILVRGPSREQQVLIVGGNPANDTLATKGLVQGFLPLPIVNSTEDFESVFADLERFFLAFCGQKVVLVSLGLPKQELFCSWLLKRLESSRSLDKDEFVLLPVGAALDFITGERTRSGKAWQRIGLEWLPRLVREPRMFIRVYRSFVALISLVLLQPRN